MRPAKSFLLLLIFLAIFIGLHYLIPADHVFPDVKEFFPSVFLKPSAGISSADSININAAADSLHTLQPEQVIQSDTLIKKTSKLIKSPIDFFLDTVKESKRAVRVIYFGDSQIEGDRITSRLRAQLRKIGGGTGPGLLQPLMPVMYTRSVWLTSSTNWRRYNYLSYKTGEITTNRLGPFMAICRYLPENIKSNSDVKAYVRIRPSNNADSASSQFETLRLFYSKKSGKVIFRVLADGASVYSDTLHATGGINEVNCKLYGARDIELSFEGKISPDIYGFSIESTNGVIVDNIPQRGSAGLEFTMVDSVNLEQSLRTLRPDLIILHYGLNIVKNIRNEYSYYQEGLYRQISLLRKIAPGVPVVIVGVTDMALAEGDSARHYNNIPSIIIAQKKAAERAGVLFWNSYSAMGGKNSIVRWSQSKPALAQKDYIHFTIEGADSLSALLCSSVFTPTKPIAHYDTIITPKQAIVAPAEVVSAPTDIKKTGETSFWNKILTVLRGDPTKPFVFTSPAFWIFFLFVLAGYSLVYRKMIWRNVYLFLVSLLFYYIAGGLFLFILIFVTIIDYSCGFLIYRSTTKLTRYLFLLISIVSNLSLLGYFKYTGFIITSVNSLFGTSFEVYDFLSKFSNSILGTSFDVKYIILPVGISFFTFQSLSYTIDVYRRRMEPVRNIIDFGFYVSFFPHLVAGPIVRASVFIPQIYNEFKVTKQEFSHALFMISKGLIKKIIISNFIALNLVDRVFDAPSVYSGFENLLAVYGYGLQIYCDFSGYTDIAIGVALVLGFRLPVNFNSPYKAASITDFWKRWHISLSQWLRDYVYISMGGNRKGKLRTYFNLMMTMLIGGLWHGASLKFIIWGGLHGAGLVVNKIWDKLFSFHRRYRLVFKAIAIFITFQFVNFCWIFFRAPDLSNAGIMLKQIFGSFSPGSYSTVLPAYGSALILMFTGYVIHFLPEKIKESYRGLFINLPVALQLSLVMIVAVLLYQMRTTEIMPFIYFRF